MALVSELRRRNVFRMAALYVVAAWLIMQVAEVVMGLANLPNWVGPAVLAVLAIGFPIAVIFSWVYEITPEGLALEKEVKREESITHITGRRLDFLVISLLAAALAVFAIHTWWPSTRTEPDNEFISLEAEIPIVYYVFDDPNPLVQGKGVELLKKNKINVSGESILEL